MEGKRCVTRAQPQPHPQLPAQVIVVRRIPSVTSGHLVVVVVIALKTGTHSQVSVFLVMAALVVHHHHPQDLHHTHYQTAQKRPILR